MPFDGTLIEDNGDSTEDFTWSDNSDIIRKIGPDQKYITFRGDDGSRIKISLLDLDGVGELSDDEISEMLREILGVTIQSPEGIDLVNTLAKKAYNYLKEQLFYTDEELRSVGKLEFISSKDIIRFFRDTRRSSGLKKCMIAKVGMLLQDGVGANVETIRAKTNSVLDNKVLPNLERLVKRSSLSFEDISVKDQMNEKGKSEFSGTLFVEGNEGNPKKISFTVQIRAKSIESSISKALRDKDYINQGDIKDLLGVRIITDNKEDTLIVMNFISQLTFKYGDFRIKNKGYISPGELNDIIENSEFFSENEGTLRFVESLEKAIGSVEKKMSTASKYSDIKLVPDGDGKHLSFEIIFEDKDNSSNVGLANHIVFEYMRKIGERIRLEGYISFTSIQRLTDILVNTIVSSSKKQLSGISSYELLKSIIIDIYEEYAEDESVEKKSEKEIRKMSKQELGYLAKELLLIYFTNKLEVYKDSKNRVSRKRKFTNKMGRETMSVLLSNKY